MLNKVRYVLYFVLVTMIMGCNEKIKTEKTYLIGQDIEEVKSIFESESFYVSSIVDQTREGKNLTMSIELKKSTLLDSISYAAEVDLTPWKNGEKTHLIVKSDIEGKVISVELR